MTTPSRPGVFVIKDCVLTAIAPGQHAHPMHTLSVEHVTTDRVATGAAGIAGEIT
jgi:hypothetical protein